MKTTTIYWILGIIIVAGIIIYIFNKNNETKQSQSNCGCTKNNQCGRDQYCDGCNCVTESNRIITPIFIQQPHIVNPPPRPTPMN